MDVVLRQHSANNMDIQFIASLADDCSQAFAQRSVQDLVSVLGRPHEVITMVIFGMRGCRIAHVRTPELGLHASADQVQEFSHSLAEARTG